MKCFLVAAVLASCLAMSMAEVPTSEVFKQATELMARASSTSEVLTLNLINLGILIAIAIGIIIVGIFIGGAGGGGLGGGPFFGTNNGRSADLDSPTSFGNSDMVGGMCFIMYTSGSLDKLSCIQRTACEDPKTASKYLQAAKLWHKMHKLMQIVPFNDGYLSIMNAIQDASEHSLEGGDCAIYQW